MAIRKSSLHTNYLRLLAFQFPGEPIKAWVIKDKTQVGNYHDQYDTIMELREVIHQYDVYIIIHASYCYIVIGIEAERQVDHVAYLEFEGTEYHGATTIEQIYDACVAAVNFIQRHEIEKVN